ncbi:AAA family ATPase [Jatrophihabitans sp. YIM 134969]
MTASSRSGNAVTASPRPAPLRSDLLAQVVRQARETTSLGQPVVVYIRGEAGSGKSTFAREVAAQLSDRVVTQTSIAAEAAFAHVALTDVVEELAALCGRDPEPLTSGDDLPTTPVLGLHLRDRLVAAASAGPVVVVVDDLQWMDTDSRDVLAFALRRLRDVPVVVVVAIRTEPGRADDAEDTSDHRGRRLGAVARLDVDLDPVPVPRLRALVRQVAPDLGPDDLDAVVEQSGGNPFWAVELARSGAARAGAGVDLRRASPTARERLAALAAALTDEQRLVVAAVRLAGRPLTEELVAAVGGELADPRDAVDAAERVGVIRLAGQRWTTSHPLLGEAALQVLPQARRAALLRQLADAAEDPERRVRFAAEVERPPHEPTARELAEVAEWAASRGSLASAVGLMEQSVRFTPDTDERVRGERLAALASLHLRQGAFTAVLTTAEQVDLDLLAPPAFDAFAAAVADAAALVHGRDAAQRVVGQVEASAARRADPMSRAVAAALTTDRDYGTALGTEASEIAERAAAVLETATWPSPTTHMLLGSLCTMRLDRGDGLDADLIERRRRLEPALRGAGLSPPSTDSADALAAYVSKQLGDPQTSLARLPALIDTADRSGEDFAGFAFRVHLATTHQVCGEFGASRRVLAEARERRGWVPSARFPLLLPALVTQALADSSTAAAAEVLARETAGLERGPARWQVVVAYQRGVAALDDGRHDEALACLTEALTLAVDLGIHEPGRRHEVDVALVETHLARGDLDAAADLLDDLDAFIRPRGRRSLMAVVDRLTGTLTALRGEPDRAVTQLASAAVRAAARPFRLEHARTVLALADAHARREDPRAASDALDSARRLYTDMGYAAGVELVERRRAALRTDDTALTPAERAVVDAVVAGATARQAGVDLSISHRTVEAHLRSVYRKLGVRGRVELTALALRGELD